MVKIVRTYLIMTAACGAPGEQGRCTSKGYPLLSQNQATTPSFLRSISTKGAQDGKHTVLSSNQVDGL